MSYVDGILEKNETIVSSAKITKLFLIGVWLKGIFLFFLLFIPTVKAIIETIRLNKTELCLTNKRIIGKKGIIARDCVDSKLDKIQTIRIEESFLGRIFNYGTVIITTAGTARAEYYFVGVVRANEFKKLVNEQIEEYEEEKSRKQASTFAGVVK